MWRFVMLVIKESGNGVYGAKIVTLRNERQRRRGAPPEYMYRCVLELSGEVIMDGKFVSYVDAIRVAKLVTELEEARWEQRELEDGGSSWEQRVLVL